MTVDPISFAGHPELCQSTLSIQSYPMPTKDFLNACKHLFLVENHTFWRHVEFQSSVLNDRRGKRRILAWFLLILAIYTKLSYNYHHVEFVFNPSQISFSSVSYEWPHKKFQINPLITSCLLDFVFLFYIRSKTSLNYEMFCTFFKQDVSGLRYDLRFPKYAQW